jgi:hypothetical protein
MFLLIFLCLVHAIALVGSGYLSVFAYETKHLIIGVFGVFFNLIVLSINIADIIEKLTGVT